MTHYQAHWQRVSWEILWRQAAHGGHVAVLDLFWRHDTRLFTNTTAPTAAQFGHLDALKWFYRYNGGRFDMLASDACFEKALAHGHVAVADWLVAQEGVVSIRSDILEHAIQHWNEAGIQWLLTRGCSIPWNLLDLVLRPVFDTNTTPMLARIQWLHAHVPALSCSSKTMVLATAWGVPCLQWLHTTMHGELTSNVFYAAVTRPQTDTLRWLLDNACPMDTQSAMQIAISCGCLAGIQFLVGEQHLDSFLTHDEKRDCIEEAAGRSVWPIVQWLHDHGEGYPLTAVVWQAAYARRARDMLAWLIQHQCPMFPDPYPPRRDDSEDEVSVDKEEEESAGPDVSIVED